MNENKYLCVKHDNETLFMMGCVLFFLKNLVFFFFLQGKRKGDEDITTEISL